jgi:hypothetical protein
VPLVGGLAGAVAVVAGVVAAGRGIGKRRLRLVPETRALLERVIEHCDAVGSSYTPPPDRATAERLYNDVKHLQERLPLRLSSQLSSACGLLPVIYGDEPDRNAAFCAGRTVERADRLRKELVRRERRGF